MAAEQDNQEVNKYSRHGPGQDGAANGDYSATSFAIMLPIWVKIQTQPAVMP